MAYYPGGVAAHCAPPLLLQNDHTYFSIPSPQPGIIPAIRHHHLNPNAYTHDGQNLTLSPQPPPSGTVLLGSHTVNGQPSAHALSPETGPTVDGCHWCSNHHEAHMHDRQVQVTQHYGGSSTTGAQETGIHRDYFYDTQMRTSSHEIELPTAMGYYYRGTRTSSQIQPMTGHPSGFSNQHPHGYLDGDTPPQQNKNRMRSNEATWHDTTTATATTTNTTALTKNKHDIQELDIDIDELYKYLQEIPPKASHSYLTQWKCVYPHCRKSNEPLSRAKARDHILRHLAMKTHICITCNVWFADHAKAQRHCEDAKVHNCLWCHKCFARPDNLKEHMRKCHWQSTSKMEVA